MKKSLFILSTITMLSSSSLANSLEVNGKLGDECELLIQRIEETIKYIKNETRSEYDNHKAALYVSDLNLNDLISAYKNLCD